MNDTAAPSRRDDIDCGGVEVLLVSEQVADGAEGPEKAPKIPETPQPGPPEAVALCETAQRVSRERAFEMQMEIDERQPSKVSANHRSTFAHHVGWYR